MPLSLAVSVLGLVQAALEKRVDTLDALLTLGTALVALGLLYEYGYDFSAFKKPKTGLFRWVTHLTHFGAILVTVGVAGELYVGVMASRAQEALRNLNSLVVAGLNKEAGDARLKAAEAEDTAGKAMVRVRELDLQLEKLRTPRTLTPAQQRHIEAKLRPFSDTPYELAVDPIPEAMNLVGTLDLVLRASGWSPRDSSKTDFRSIFTAATGSKIEQEFLSGIAIKGTRESLIRFGSAVAALIAALKAKGIDSRVEILRDDDPSPTDVPRFSQPVITVDFKISANSFGVR